LNRLAESFPRFLAETRPGPAAAPSPAWPDFLIDLATLELAIAEIFDGPGAEGEPLLAPAGLLALQAAGGFAAARLVPVPCLRLLHFRYPVNAFYSLAREAAAAESAGTAASAASAGLPLPDPAAEHVALSRTDFVVRRHTLSPFEAAILAALLAGAAVGDAIASAAAASDQADGDLEAQLEAAFRRWTAAGFFRAAAVPSPLPAR
jgi:hypothetical protein